MIMNKLQFLITLITVLLTFQACKSNIKDESMVDSFTTVKRSSGKVNVIVEKADADFITEAARNSLSEMELGKLARQKSNNKRIKSFGMIMIAAHSKINNKIKSLASAKNISLLTVADPAKQNEISMLSKKAGNDFDKAYISNMIEDYKKGIATFENAAKNCADPDVKSFAAKTLPTLQAHFDAINAINYSMQ
jgi:putative membrane protein